VSRWRPVAERYLEPLRPSFQDLVQSGVRLTVRGFERALDRGDEEISTVEQALSGSPGQHGVHPPNATGRIRETEAVVECVEKPPPGQLKRIGTVGYRRHGAL
jgi:hypothetical protein